MLGPKKCKKWPRNTKFHSIISVIKIIKDDIKVQLEHIKDNCEHIKEDT